MTQYQNPSPPPPQWSAGPPGPYPGDRRDPSGARRLRRSSTNRRVAGVAGGLAEYLGAEPAALRLAFVVLTFLSGGMFVLAYVLAWAVMPGEDSRQAVHGAPYPSR